MIRLFVLIPLFLKVYCVVHAYKNQKPQWWIWVIILIPLGSFFYFFTEVISKRQAKDTISIVNENVSNKIQPTRKISQLEAQLEFSDTITNRVQLAAEYINLREYHKACEILEDAAKGIYEDDIELLTILAHGYFMDKKYEKSVELFKRLKKVTPVIKPIGLYLQYVDALLEISDLDTVESELISIVKNTDDIEATFKLGMFYKEGSNVKKAKEYFQLLLVNSKQLPKQQYKNSQTWIDGATIELDYFSRNQ